MNILNLLSSSDYLIINKSLVKEIGINETILLSELISEYNYWISNEGLDDEGMFYSTVENVEENTTLNDYMQRKAINNLIAKGLIEVKVKCVPAKRFIKIITKNIEKLFLEEEQPNNDDLLKTSSKNFKELDVKNLKTNNNNIKLISVNKDLSNNKSLLEKEKIQKKKSLLEKPKQTKKEKLYNTILNDILIKSKFYSNDIIRDLLVRWINSLYEVNKLPSTISLEDTLTNLEIDNFTENEIIDAINKSIRAGYKTIYIEHKENISIDGINRNGTNSYEQEEKQTKSAEYILKNYS